MNDTTRDTLLPQLAATQRPLTQARTLPGAVFRDAGLFHLEQAYLFDGAWHAVARAEDLPGAGAFRRVTVQGEDVLLTRDADSRLHAHYNVCLHRGSRLVDARAGTLEHIRCPYHAWCYALDGRLTHVPRAERPLVEGPAGNASGTPRLARVGVSEWGGYVFVNLRETAEPPPACWPDLPSLNAYRMDTLRRAHREVYEVRANWKLIAQNYSECYHCAVAHPQLVRISQDAPRDDPAAAAAVVVGDTCNGGPMMLREGVQTMSMSGRAALPTVARLDEAERRLVHYYLVYPNLLLSPHPDYVLVHTLTPLAPDRTRVSCDWLVAPAGLACTDAVADVVDFWHATNRQDWVLCERNQAGVASRGYAPGTYHPSEACVHAFDRWYAREMSRVLGGGEAG